MGEVRGMRELDRKLKILPNKVKKKILRRAIKLAAIPMAESISARAPRSDGPGPHMADNILIKSRISQTGEARTRIGPSKAHFYSSFIEFGTRYIPAHPFVRPAFDGTVDVSLRIVGKELWAGIKKVAR